jgi:hypothetical protein
MVFPIPDYVEELGMCDCDTHMAALRNNPRYAENNGPEVLRRFKRWHERAKEWRDRDREGFRRLCVEDRFIKHLHGVEGIIRSIGLRPEDAASWRQQTRAQLFARSEEEVDKEVLGMCPYQDRSESGEGTS